jgi:replicative superfamily II helicase
MDHNSESLQTIAPAADEIHVLQDSQDSRFHRLQREHTLKWRRLNQEYEAKRAQIEARQHDEEQSFTSAFEQNLKTIQHALTWIQESVESTIAKRVNLELNKNSLRRVYEDEMTREESDLHEKIHGIIKSSRHKSNQTSTSPSLERAPTSPCTPVSKPLNCQDV